MCAEQEIITRNRSERSHKRNEIAEGLWSDPDVGEDFYKERMGSVTDEFLPVVWPAGTYSQTTMLNLLMSRYASQNQDAFRWSAKISVRASELASESTACTARGSAACTCGWRTTGSRMLFRWGRRRRCLHDNLYWVDGDEAVRRVSEHPPFATT